MKKLLILALSLSVLLGAAACGKKNDNSAASAVDTNAKELKITASTKTFKFDQEEYRVKKGEPITITLVNAEGTHGIDIKELNVSLSAAKLTKTITPDKPGTYDIICNYPCGTGHMQMRSKLIVE